LESDLTSVELTTSAHVDGVTYSLTVNGVQDRADPPNVIAADSRIDYSYSPSLEISELLVVSGKPYVVAAGLQTGSLAYIDRAYSYESVPDPAAGSTFIRTANDDKPSSGDGTFLSFRANMGVTVYVAHDDRYTVKPGWLGNFVDTGMDVVISGQPHSLYGKEFPGGAIELGGNTDPDATGDHNMYTVVVVGQGTPPVGQPPAPPTGLTAE
jgi:hypothetical protein